MSKSLAIRNGDLAIGRNRALATVNGRQKLMQDLMLWIMERIGTDPSTPLYGNRLDGGMVDGQPVLALVGQIMTEELENAVVIEVVELLKKYQILQLEKIKGEIARYNGKHTLEADEVIESIKGVEAIAVNDAIIVRAHLKTVDSRNFRLTIPVKVV